jgi:hypothetical protein
MCAASMLIDCVEVLSSGTEDCDHMPVCAPAGEWNGLPVRVTDVPLDCGTDDTAATLAVSDAASAASLMHAHINSTFYHEILKPNGPSGLCSLRLVSVRIPWA